MFKAVLVLAATFIWAPLYGSELRIYSATDLAAIGPLLDDFAQQNRELNIHYVEFNTQELYNELTAPTLPAPDLVISSAADLQVKLVNDGYAQPISDIPDVAPNQPWARWADELFGFTYEPIVFVYNKQAFSNRAIPHTHEALAEQLRDHPDFYHHKIGTYDASSSGLGYLVASQDEEAFSLTGRLQESLGRALVNVYCCSAQLLDSLSSGELLFGYNLLGSYAMAKTLEDDRIGVIIPEDYTLVIVRSAFVHREAKNLTAASDFIRYLRSQAGQSKIASQTALLPLDKNLSSRSDAKHQLNSSTNFHPIRLGPELLVYLDQSKRRHFIDSWRQAMMQ